MQSFCSYTLPNWLDMNPTCKHEWAIKMLSGSCPFHGGIFQGQREFFLALFVNVDLSSVLCLLFEKMQSAEEMVDGRNDLSEMYLLSEVWYTRGWFKNS
jgi:hypothetical protein